ncbi:MAG: aspartyl protease family protein [Sphingobium phenoxybenzoativorans]
MSRFRKTLALIAIMAPALAVAQDAPSLDPDDPPALVRTGVDKSDRITIPIRIGGSGPYDFIIDTGSQRTVLSRELAARLALAASDRVKVLSMTGLSDVDTVTVPDLSFGSSRMTGVQAPVFAGDHIGAPGLLGLDGLKRKRLVLNFRTGQMNITPSAPTPKREDSDTIIVEARTKLGQLILVDSNADGRKVHVILDTGSEYSIGNPALLAKLARKKPGAYSGTVSITSVTGEQLLGQWGFIHQIKMGGVVIKDVPVIFADASPFRELDLEDKPALLLGINVLRGFNRVAIDFGRRRVDFVLPDQGAAAGRQLALLDAPPLDSPSLSTP